MFLTPAKFQDFLSRSNHIDDIYNALHDDDLSKVVLTALEVLKKTHQLPYIMKKEKNEKLSTLSREQGNIGYKNDNLDMAILCYNKAILLAPKDSKELKLAISNRSALFQKYKIYIACIKDIDICFSMGCPSEIVNKLKKRKKEVESLAKEIHRYSSAYNAICRKYVECTFDNLDISCASSYIKAKSSDMPKIVASEDIKIGSVLITETSFVSSNEKRHYLVHCHYCQKKTFNLIPCENCIYALFCNDECKNKCFDEYHKYECSVIHVVNEICHGPMPFLMLKATLKLRQKCKTWRELIEASYSMGIDRMRSSSTKEIFDAESLFSVLNQKDNMPFFYGNKYDASFVCAALLHYLGEIPSFFPKDIDEKKQATHALGRIMMFLSLHIIVNKIYVPLKTRDGKFKYDAPAFGLFSLIGKLNNSCTPNTIAFYNGNKMSLIALQPIKSGEELTISFQLHWLNSDESRHNRNVTHFLFNGKVCSCHICIAESPPHQQLSKSQKTMFDSLDLNKMDNLLLNRPENVSTIYEKTLEALEQLKDVPHSSEYKEVYKRFSECKFYIEVFTGPMQ